jgi:hypothetical protein
MFSHLGTIKVNVLARSSFFFSYPGVLKFSPKGNDDISFSPRSSFSPYIFIVGIAISSQIRIDQRRMFLLKKIKGGPG